MSTHDSAINETTVSVTESSGQPWRRLSGRMIVVDVVQVLVSALPLLFAVFVLRIEDNLVPVLALAGFGAVGAGYDVLRWIVTRYRITDTYVELRSGIVVRSYRSVRRDRIRSVDIEAKLRHRLWGLRVVKIGAGQQTAANEAAFFIDAVRKDDAENLRHLLLRKKGVHPGQKRSAGITDTDTGQVFATLHPWWVVYNMFTIWGFVMVAGLLWGGYWLLMAFGINGADWIAAAVKSQDTFPIGWLIFGLIAAAGVLGAIGLGINFFIEYWNFTLTRVEGDKGTLLRTRQGLLTTREVNRDDRRMRGLTIGEPLLWRWMHMADTNLITTGLSVLSMSQPTAILPRGPHDVARRVAQKVLNTATDLFSTPLTPHPIAALRRRLTWSTGVAAVIAAVLVWLSWHSIIHPNFVWVALGLWPLFLIGAVIAYRSLGHAIKGKYLVVRSGLANRTTSVLQRTAVSTVAIRQSPLQWRLRLKTVSVMTSAGWGIYQAIDIDAEQAIEFANEASAGLLEPFLVEQK